MNALLSLSNDLARAVERAGQAVVAVNARQRLPSTGVHWRPGVIVTAEHTVRRDEEVTITRPDGRDVGAALAGRDRSTDLAVLRVDDTTMPVAERADAAALRAGHIVLALGHGPAASWGVVSAVGGEFRTWRGGRIDRFIRLDLTMYPGFSGGPLVDTEGRVTAINSSGLSRQLCLAIPGSTVDRIVDELLRRGRIARGYLGVGMQPVRLPEALRARLGRESDAAVIVVAVARESPAAQAGVTLGDVLVALDGQPVTDVRDVQTILGPERVGATVRASMVRAGEPREVMVTIAERPARER
jgi:serine protease DegQ